MANTMQKTYGSEPKRIVLSLMSGAMPFMTYRFNPTGGDIRPISDITRMFAVIEAMTGVLYSAALIGRMRSSTAHELESGFVTDAETSRQMLPVGASDDERFAQPRFSFEDDVVERLT